MSTIEEESRFWAGKAVGAYHNRLENIQNSAGKWQAAIAAFLGVFVTVGFVLSPDKLAALPVRGIAEVGILVAYGVAGICGTSAYLVLAKITAERIPVFPDGEVVTGVRMRQAVIDRANVVHRLLGRAIRLAAVGGIVAIATSTFLLVAQIRAENHHYATVISPTGGYCGELLDSRGRLSLKLPNGNMVSVEGSLVTPVSSCPP